MRPGQCCNIASDRQHPAPCMNPNECGECTPGYNGECHATAANATAARRLEGATEEER